MSKIIESSLCVTFPFWDISNTHAAVYPNAYYPDSRICVTDSRVPDSSGTQWSADYINYSRGWLLYVQTRSNTVGCFVNGETKRRWANVYHSRPTIRMRYMYAHAILIRRTDGDLPEISRNCNGPVTRYGIHLGRYNGLTSQWTGVRWCHFRNNHAP